MKTVIVYASSHHGNTKKLVEALAAGADIALLDVEKSPAAQLGEYDAIGFASGIYFSRYHASLLDFARKNLPENKKVFFLHTAGSPRESQSGEMRAIAGEKGCVCLGCFCCKGYDTYGPFRLVGGIAKGHPDEGDVQAARAFYRRIAG